MTLIGHHTDVLFVLKFSYRKPATVCRRNYRRKFRLIGPGRTLCSLIKFAFAPIEPQANPRLHGQRLAVAADNSPGGRVLAPLIVQSRVVSGSLALPKHTILHTDDRPLK